MHPANRAAAPLFICGDKGVAQWPYAWTAPDGQVTELRGCDMYEFRGDQIRRNNAFRKTWKELRQGKMLQLTPGYAPRPVRFLALWEWQGWRMNVYGISAHAEYPQRRFARAILGKITRIDLASSDSVPDKL